MQEDSQPTLIGALWQFRVMAGIIVAAVMTLSIGVALLVAPPATATATIALTTPPADSIVSAGTQSEASLARYTSQRARFVTSDAVMRRAAEQLGRDDVTELRRSIDASASGTSNTIVVAAEADTEEEAVAIAEAVVSAYQQEAAAEYQRLTNAAIAAIAATETQINETIGADPDEALASSAADTIGQLRLRVGELLVNQSVFDDGVDFVDAPRSDGAQAASLPIREAGLGLVVGLALAATASWLRADRDSGVEDPMELEAALGAPNFGVLRHRGDLQLLSPVQLEDTPSHEYRLIWSALVRQVNAGVLIVASEGVDARSVAALNIAAAASRDNLSVLLVDADLRTSQISLALTEGYRQADGFASAVGEGDWRKSTTNITMGGLRSLTLLPAGSVGRTDPDVSTHRIETIVEEMRSSFDLVVIDAGAVDSSQLNAILYGAADGVLAIVSQGSARQTLDTMRRRISLQGTEIIGGIFAVRS